MGHRYISIGEHSSIAFDCVIFAGPPVERGAEYLRLDNPAFVFQAGEVVIGRYVFLSRGCYILGNGGVSIGDYCCCAEATSILSMTNHYASFSDPANKDIYFTHGCGPEHECYLLGPIVLDENVGVASRCILLPAVTISRDSFLAIGSVAQKGIIPPNSIAEGNPARRIKQRYREKTDES
ncbi:MAG: hypothetical protein JXB29_01570 [Sedimentisphaerales bacterium]|nr:hypothetical protein [Sedimentisphaerales bacterium]